MQRAGQVQHVDRVHDDGGLLLHGRHDGAELGRAHGNGYHAAIVRQADAALAHGLGGHARRGGGGGQRRVGQLGVQRKEGAVVNQRRRRR